MSRKFLSLAVLVVVIVTAAGIALWSFYGPNPDALWQIIDRQCVPEAREGTTHNRCAKVDLAGGYVIFKDRNGIAQYLMMPTARISGIESPDLTKPDAPNYWRDAWESRSFVERAANANLSIGEVGFAINSVEGRSQNQLHIHMDCMRPDVVAALAAERKALTDQWSDLPEPLSGHHYRARLIEDGTLSLTDPFKILFADIHTRGESMAGQTLLLTGTTLNDGKPGFILLNDHVQANDHASAEELLDHSCSVRKRLLPR